MKPSDFQVSIPISIPPPTARDLELRRAAGELGRHVRFQQRAEFRAAGLTVEPKATIYFRGIPSVWGGGPLAEMLPGEEEWIAARAAEKKG